MPRNPLIICGDCRIKLSAADTLCHGGLFCGADYDRRPDQGDDTDGDEEKDAVTGDGAKTNLETVAKRVRKRECSRGQCVRK